MNPRTTSISLVAIAALLVPASASAEYLVPEGNSAVTQYTEGFPTAGGEKKTEGNEKPVSVGKAIGSGNAKKLEDHGADGAAAAELAAETAPTSVVPASTEGSGDRATPPKKKGDGGKSKQSKPAEDGGQADNDTATLAPIAEGDGPSGSSGLSEILGTATGSASGSLGLLLPLVLIAALAWGFAFLWRQRQHHEPTVDRHR